MGLSPLTHSDHTAHVFLDLLHGEGEPGYTWLTVLGAGAAGVGVAIAFLLFRSEASLVLVFLTALGIMPTLDRMLVRNREAHLLALHGDRPDERLAKSLLSLFVGAFLLFGLVALLVDRSVVEVLFDRQLNRYVAATDIRSLQFGSLDHVLVNNVLVLLTVLLFSIVYRAGGVALVLLWNASVWGAVLAWVARLSATDGPGLSSVLYRFFAGLIAVGPHLFFESMGYVIAAMAGVSIVRGFVKGGRPADVKRPLFQLSVALVLILVGALTEGILPPLVIQAVGL